MTKNDFLNELSEKLNILTLNDKKQSLDYYGEMIDDIVENGLSEEEAVKSIGSPSDVAREILNEMPLSRLIQSRVKKRQKQSAWQIALLVMASPLLIAFAAVAVSLIMTFYAVIWSVIISFWAAEFSIAVSGIAAIISGIVCIFIPEFQSVAVPLFGAGLFLAGLSVFAFFGCLYTTKGAVFLCKKFNSLVKSIFIKKGDTL